MLLPREDISNEGENILNFIHQAPSGMLPGGLCLQDPRTLTDTASSGGIPELILVLRVDSLMPIFLAQSVRHIDTPAKVIMRFDLLFLACSDMAAHRQFSFL